MSLQHKKPIKLVREVNTGVSHTRWMYGLALGWCLAILGGLGMLASFVHLDICSTYGGMDNPAFTLNLGAFVLSAAGVACGCLVLACASTPTRRGADCVRLAHCAVFSLGTLSVTGGCLLATPPRAAVFETFVGSASLIAGILLIGGSGLAMAIRHKRGHRLGDALPSRTG